VAGSEQASAIATAKAENEQAEAEVEYRHAREVPRSICAHEVVVVEILNAIVKPGVNEGENKASHFKTLKSHSHALQAEI